MEKVQMIGLSTFVCQGINVDRGTRFNAPEWLAPQLVEKGLAECAEDDPVAAAGTNKDGTELVVQPAAEKKKNVEQVEASRAKRKADTAAKAKAEAKAKAKTGGEGGQ